MPPKKLRISFHSKPVLKAPLLPVEHLGSRAVQPWEEQCVDHSKHDQASSAELFWFICKTIIPKDYSALTQEARASAAWTVIMYFLYFLGFFQNKNLLLFLCNQGPLGGGGWLENRERHQSDCSISRQKYSFKIKKLKRKTESEKQIN